ncbi:MAG TPA: carboxypeptidase regulatory-like domain-containing protein [Anaerolineae bacterium]|nr:carboxypeptidase regulatory-like domain-containing protein [Anaerolineae bacterium]
MMKDWRQKLWLGGLLALLLFPLVTRGDVTAAPPAPLRAAVGAALRADLSPPLREMADRGAPARGELRRETSLPLPTFRLAPTQEDPVLQARLGPLSMPAPLYSFDGVNNVNNIHPPDTQGDIGYDPATGKKYYVQWVNLSFAIWDVTTATPVQVYGPVGGRTLWQGFGGVCETTNHGDPITLFDTMANRWLMSQFSYGGPYYQCIAISQTADPTGAWYRYAFQVSATKMNDYPKFGVWPDGYYMTANQFTGGSSWGGAGVFVFDRSKLLLGDPTATFQYFDLYGVNPDFGGMLPSDMDGANPPPSGAPNYFVAVDDGTWIGPDDAMRIWEFHVDWATPANSTFGLNGQPNHTLPVAEWTPVGYNIPQPGTSYTLDSLGDRLMYRLAYRNYGAHESLVVNHTVDAGGHAGVRWYEVRDPGGAPVIYQQGTFAPDAEHRWMGSLAMDAAGNMALGYSVSSSNVYPSVRYTGRLANDPLNQMPQGEESLVVGSGVQLSSYSRWGDYSMMGIDPLDDCTFWFTQEYMQSTGVSSWSTRIGAFRFPSCAQLQLGALRGVVSDAATGSPVGGAVVAAQGVEAAVSTVSASDGYYALALTGGAYTVTAQAYGYQPYQQPHVTVDATLTTTLNISMTAAPPVVVSGVISDARTGWPLYARVRVTGTPFNPLAPNDAVWSDPVTGFYSLTLASGSAYTFAATSWVAGYTPATAAVGPLISDTVRDFALSPDLALCAAPGYTLVRAPAYAEGFADGLPDGATLIDNAGDGVVWRFDDPELRDNLTGGSGAFAIVDSDHEAAKEVDAELRLPSLDLSALSTALLEFKYDFRWYSYGQSESADVDVSVNGGDTWTNVWRRSGGSDRGPQTARVDLSALAAGQPDARIRFRYYDARSEWWWQVDDVFVGPTTCAPAAGGLVVGEVRDANTQAAVAAQVTAAAASVVAQPLEAGGGAFYTLFAPAGPLLLTATAGGYGPVVLTPTVIQSRTVRQDITLPAGQLRSLGGFTKPITVDAGITITQFVTLTNAGGYPLDFSVQTVHAPAPSGVTGPFATPVRRNSPKHPHDLDARTVRSYAPPAVPAWPGGEVVLSWTSHLTSPWGIVVLPDDTVWINDARFGGGRERYYQFSVAGVPTGEERDTFPQVAIFAADMTYDPEAHTVWQVNVGEDNCVYELDAVTFTGTGRAICPDFGVSVRGLAYDPATQTFFGGSWNDQILYHFDRTGRILASWDVALNFAGMAYNPVSGHLFALSNAAVGRDIYVLDMRDAGAFLGGFDIAGLGDYAQAGLALDTAGYLWAVNQSTGEVFKVTLGEPLLPWDHVPWLTAAPLTGAIGMGEHQPLTLTLDTSGMAPGDYSAHLRVNNSAPYGPLNLPITMTVIYRHNVAVAPLTLTQTAAPNMALHYTLWVTNTGLETDNYHITVSGDPWPLVFPLTVGPLTAGESVPLSLTATVPPEALCGARAYFTVTVTSGADGFRTAQAYLTVAASAVYGVQAAQPSALAGDPGETLESAVLVTNTGNCRDTLAVSAFGGWALPPLTPTVTLTAGASAPITVPVRIPASAPGGASETTVLTVQSQSAAALSATTWLTVTANSVYTAALSPAAASRRGFPGADVTYTFVLTNLGNVTDTFTFSALDGQWSAIVRPLSATLAAQGMAPVVLTVTVPATATPGVYDTLTLRAVGGGESISSAITTTAGCLPVSAPSFVYAPAQPIAGQPVTFTGAVGGGTPPITYAWNFGGGALGAGQVVSHTFTAETALTPYPVVMTATNACGQVWARETVPVRLHQMYLPLVLRSSESFTLIR